MRDERDLFANFERMRREIDQLFGDVFERPLPARRRTGFTPAVDVSYADDPPRAIVTVALPGICIDDLDIEVAGRELIISGHRRPAPAEGRVYQQIEIEHGPFRRAISLGADVVAESTQATYDDGLLRVELPISQPERRSVAVEIDSPRRQAVEG